MADDFDLAYAVRLPNDEAIEYFRARTPSSTHWNWFDLLGEAHGKSFVVAKAVRTDVLSSIHYQMRRAIEKGISEAEFVRNLEINLKKLGWWGKQVVVSPDGGAEVVQLGSPHRLRTIFRTNMEVGVAHGAYRRQVDNKAARPYWKYMALMDKATRPSHATMNGKVFRADDPIWKTHYPPNGFGCRCFVMALTEKEMEEEGLVVSDSEGHLTRIRQEAGVNKRTGEVITVRGTQYRFTGKDGKSRVMTPDPGWSYNPGSIGPPATGGRSGPAAADAAASRVIGAEARNLVRSANQTQPQVARDAVREMVMSDRFAEAFEADALRGWPLAVVPAPVLHPLIEGGVKTEAQVVTWQVQTGKLPRERPAAGIEQVRLLQQTLDRGEVIWEQPGRRKQWGRNSLLAHYWDDTGTWWRYAITIRPGNLSMITIFDDPTGDARDDVLTDPARNIVIVREWDAARWRDGQ